MVIKENKILKCFLLISLCILIILVFLSFWEFTQKSTKHARDTSEQQVAEVAVGSAGIINKEISNALNLVDTAAVGFGSFEDLHSLEALQVLQQVEENSPFLNMRLTALDGKSMKADGDTIDVSQRDYYTKALQGESTVTDTLDSLVDGREIIVFCAPVRYNGQIHGTLHGVYEIDKLSVITRIGSQGGEGYTLLIKKSGEFIFSSADNISLQGNEKDAWKIFNKAVFSGGSTMDKFYDDVQNNKIGAITYSVKDQVRSAYYAPIGINDWYLIQVITKEYIEQHYTVINEIALILIIKIIGICLIFGSIAMFVIDKSRRSRVEDLNKLKLLTDNIPGGVAEILLVDDFVIQYASDGFYALTGYTKEEYQGGFIQGHGTRIILEEDLDEAIGKVMQAIEQSRPIHTEYRLKRKDGSLIWISVDGSILKKAKNGAVIQAIFMDITVQKNRTEEILENAKLDKMTGLYDKISAQETIETYLGKQKYGTVNALIAIDIDDFKVINDTYGHQVGDEAIILLAKMLRSYFRSTDILGRIGGDEYIVLMRGVHDREYVSLRIASLIQGIGSLEVAGRTGMMTCSVGVVTFAMKEYLVFDKIFSQADRNLYEAKNAGKNNCVIKEYTES